MDITRDEATLYLMGDFDVRHTAQVRHAIQQVVLAGYEQVVVDLGGVDYIDVTALRVLGAATRLAARDGQRVLLRGCSPQVIRMLHLSRLIRAVQVDRDRVSA